MPVSFATIGSAGAGAGAGMIKGSGYTAETMNGYEYRSKGMYSMYGMGGQYDEHGALFAAGGMAAGAAGASMRSVGGLGAAAGGGAQVSFGAASAGESQAALNEEFIRGYFFDVSIAVMCCLSSARLMTNKFYSETDSHVNFMYFINNLTCYLFLIAGMYAILYLEYNRHFFSCSL